MKIDELEGALKGEAFLSSNEEGGSSRAFALRGEDLRFAFTVKGDDLPIMRQSGLLLCSDLEVVASKEHGEEAKIAGDVVVNDGLFLMDTSVLTASGGGGRSAETRPPYFSVTAQPFADFDEWVTPGGNPDATKNKFESALSTLPHSGKIGLQYHGDPVWFRHISVTELDSNSPDLNRITPRVPVDDADLRYWLGNMDAHGYSDAEASGVTGLTVEAIRTARSEIGVGSNGSTLKQTGDRLRVMPYPGGRHPRIGFLDGGIDPQRETKLSVFLPWDDRAYVVLDVPEAIHSNLGLAYLAHTHVPTIWTASGMNLVPQEWIRNEDGSFEVERTFPNGIVYRVYAVPTKDAVHLRLTLTNNTAKPLSGLRVQNCVMLRGAPEFTQLTRENRLLRQPYAAVRNPDGTRRVISAWEPCNRVWGNDRCPCFHSDPQFPDCEPGETVEVDGVLAFHEGADIDAAIARLDESDWGSFFERL